VGLAGGQSFFGTSLQGVMLIGLGFTPDPFLVAFEVSPKSLTVGKQRPAKASR
jgi:hypothetical protein